MSAAPTGPDFVAPDPPALGNRPRSASAGEVAARAAVLRRLELDVRHRLDGILAGDHTTRAYGPGSERAGARAYQPGDDARLLDWNLTARSLEPHVRTTEADRELETTLVVDRSASLDFGTRGAEKREVALGVAAAFGVLTLRSANRIGLVVTGLPELRTLPARPGRTHLMALLATLEATPRVEAGTPGVDLATGLARLLATNRRRGQIVVVSDFLDRSPWSPALRALATRHRIVAAQITDPRELELPDVGMLDLVDPETGRLLHVQTRSARLRERYAAAARARHDAVRADVRSAGAEHLDLSTDRDWVLDTLRFATRRTPAPPARPVAGRAVAAPLGGLR